MREPTHFTVRGRRIPFLPGAAGDLQRATFAARERTGRPGVGTQVKAGKLQIVDVTYDARGKSTVTPLSGWLEGSEVLSALDAL
jgi:hypothetical protein